MESNEKYDYIILKEDIALLKKCKQVLAEDGSILLLMNNQYGVQYFAGIDNFDTIYENPNQLLSKEEMEKIIKEEGFSKYQFFYPLPNYDFANAIYSDKYLPAYNDSKLANNNIYLQDNLVVFDEIKLLRNFTKNGDFTKFTNSYLIEINPKSQEKAVFYNNIRKEEFRLITKIYENQVEKEPYDEASLSHIETISENIEVLKKHQFELLDKVEEGKVISRYVTMANLYEKVVENLKSSHIEEAVAMIEKQFQLMKERFEKDRTTEINSDFFDNVEKDKFFIVKKLYIDLVLENTFIDEKENMYFYDQEWSIENCPLEFLLFRMIFNMYMMNDEINAIITREELLRKLNLFEYWEVFLKAEEKFQEQIVNKEMKQAYERKNKLENELDRYRTMESEYANYKNHIESSKRLQFLKKIKLINY